MLATNCITKIPQDIKLELSDEGVLTLKAGSKIYVPNGANVFNTVTTASDIVFPVGNLTGDSLIGVNADGTLGDVYATSNAISGDTAPSSTDSGIRWYDRANNIITQYDSSASTWTVQKSLPLAHVTRADGKFTEITQVFNGFGFFGTTVFGLPGVKVLMPNGRNADGTLKNLEITTNSVVLNSTTQTYIDNAHYNCVLNNAADQIHTVESGYYYYTYERPELGANKRWYSEKDNMWYTCFAATPTVWTEDTQCVVLTYTYHSSAPISDFEIKAPISVVNQSMSDYVVSSFVNATTGQWYRKYKSGWVEQGGVAANGATITYLIPFTDSNHVFTQSPIGSWSNNYYTLGVSRTATTAVAQYGGDVLAPSHICWYACGQAA